MQDSVENPIPARRGVNFSPETPFGDEEEDVKLDEKQEEENKPEELSIVDRIRVPVERPKSKKQSFVGARRPSLAPSLAVFNDKSSYAGTSTTSGSTNELVSFKVWRVRVVYIFALALIASLSIAALAVVQTALKKSTNNGNTINSAGGQRYLSQLLAKDALKMTLYTGNTTAILALAADMHTNVIKWNTTMYMLAANTELNDSNSTQLFENLIPYFHNMLDATLTIIASANADPLTYNPLDDGTLNIILNNEGPFLVIMNEIVAEFALNSDNLTNSASISDRSINKILNEKERLYNVNLELEGERNRTEELLLNILPSTIARSLTDHPDIPVCDLAEERDVSILFTDIVGFTSWSSDKSPSEVVAMLDSMFTGFDKVCQKHKCDKIKTIGDAYMVANELLNIEELKALGLQIRVGVASGPVVAGIVGRLKFAYDVWGDTVNTASRMESNGEPGRVHVSRSTKVLADKHFKFSSGREINVKGKGIMRTYFVTGRKEVSQLPQLNDSFTDVRSAHSTDAPSEVERPNDNPQMRAQLNKRRASVAPVLIEAPLSGTERLNVSRPTVAQLFGARRKSDENDGQISFTVVIDPPSAPPNYQQPSPKISPASSNILHPPTNEMSISLPTVRSTVRDPSKHTVSDLMLNNANIIRASSLPVMDLQALNIRRNALVNDLSPPSSPHEVNNHSPNGIQKEDDVSNLHSNGVASPTNGTAPKTKKKSALKKKKSKIESIAEEDGTESDSSKTQLPNGHGSSRKASVGRKKPVRHPLIAGSMTETSSSLLIPQDDTNTSDRRVSDPSPVRKKTRQPRMSDLQKANLTVDQFDN